MANVAPMWKGSNPSPPRGTDVEYISGKRAVWHMSRNVRKTWFVSVIKSGRVRMVRYPELDESFPVEAGDSDVWSIP